MISSECWVGRNNDSLNASIIRTLKDHLFSGNVALVGNGTEFLAVLAPGAIQHNTTKSGATLSIQIKWRPSPILRDSVGRTNGIFISRAPYMHKTLFTSNVFTLVSTNESYDEVYRNRLAYPVKLRSPFASWVSAALGVTWTFSLPGVVCPLDSLPH